MSLLGNIWVKLGLKSDDFNKGLDTAERKTSKFGAAMKGIAAKVLTVAAALKAVASSFKTLANFEASASKLASVLGKTTGDIKDLTQSAIDLGRRTQYTASEVVGLQTELAKLGFVQDDIKAMQEGVLKFAAAVGTDLSSAAARAGATMRGFGLTADETNNMLNVMAVSTSKSALSFNYLDSTLGKLVPVTRAFGLDTESTIALLGTLANAGIDASSAGTSLRNILIQLSDKSSKLNAAIGKQPKTMEELIEAFQTLTDKHVGLEQAQDLVDKRSASVLLALMNNADACRELYGELQNANGALDEMYATMTTNVLGGINQVKSAWEGLILTLQNSTGVIASVLTRFARGLNIINDLANGMSLADAKAKQLGETLMQSGKFTTVEEYQREIERVKKTLAEGTDKPTAGMSQEELRKLGVQQMKNRKDLEQYLSGLEYAAFQKSRQDQEKALNDMFKEVKPITVTVDTDDALKDLLESITGGKGKEAAEDIEDVTRAAREYAQELSEINAYDDEMAATAQAIFDAFREESGAIDEVTQSLVEMNYAQIAALDQAEQTKEKIAELSQNMADALRSGAISALDELAEAIGTGNWDTSSMIRALLTPLADAAISAGTLIMTTGTALEALQEAFESWFSKAGPYGAIIAGAALVAVGTAAKAGLSAIAKGGSANAGGAGSNYTYTGGYGTTPAAIVNNAGAMEIEGTVTVKGQDLQIALDNYNKNRTR